jgi:hypothetical protein
VPDKQTWIDLYILTIAMIAVVTSLLLAIECRVYH